MSDHRNALEHIMHLCAESRTYTRRDQTINEVAMQALGMTQNQRQQVHVTIMNRIGGQPIVDAYLARCKKRNDKRAAKEREAADAAEDFARADEEWFFSPNDGD